MSIATLPPLATSQKRSSRPSAHSGHQHFATTVTPCGSQSLSAVSRRTTSANKLSSLLMQHPCCIQIFRNKFHMLFQTLHCQQSHLKYWKLSFCQDTNLSLLQDPSVRKISATKNLRTCTAELINYLITSMSLLIRQYFYSFSSTPVFKYATCIT